MTDHLLDPRSGGFGDSLRSALLARRVVLVRGDFDAAEASELAAALMTLDATGDSHIELRLTAASSSFEVALMLIDVISVLGVPVQTAAIGLVSGGAVGLLAAGAERSVARHARLHLREPDVGVAGRAAEIERALAEQAARRDVFYSQLAARVGRGVEEIGAEWASGCCLEADDALSLGYADVIEG